MKPTMLNHDLSHKLDKILPIEYLQLLDCRDSIHEFGKINLTDVIYKLLFSNLDMLLYYQIKKDLKK
jgi:hypothetical protein